MTTSILHEINRVVLTRVYSGRFEFINDEYDTVSLDKARLQELIKELTEIVNRLV